MRTLIALTVLMLALAGAVWWKTSGGGAEGGDPAPPADAGMGRLTMGIDGNAARTREAGGTGGTGGGEASEAGMGGDQQSGPQSAGGDAGGDAQAAPPPEPEPEPAPEPEPGPQPLRHVVKPGETMYRIVLNAYGTAPKELIRAVADANRIADPADIDEGQELVLPVVEGYAAPAAG